MGKNALETLVSFSELWGVVLTLVGALLLFVTVVANKPLKRILADEARKEREESERERLALQAKIAEAKKASDEANERAALANERAELERLARIRIEERLAARRIEAEELHSLADCLKPYAGTTVIVTKIGDLEASQFADDLIKMFSEAKWRVQMKYVGTMSPPVYGLQYMVDDSPAGKAVGRALSGLPTATVRAGEYLPSAGHAAILVGLKPPP